MIYFGENNDYIMCECESCKREIYAERGSVLEEDAYAYHLANPVRCPCGSIDEYINRAKKSCYHIKQELSALSSLLHKQQSIASRISAINSEMNKKFNPPTFWQSLAADFIFAGKIFLIMLGAAAGLEVFLFIITLLMFFGGLALGMEDISRAGNELFYNLNIFKDRGGRVLARIGFDPDFPVLEPELAQEQIILDYVPYALAGLVNIIFYIFLAVFIIKASVNIFKLVFFASRSMNQKIKVIRRKEAFEREIGELRREHNSLGVRVDELDILAPDYKNARAADMILKYFENNRADSIREALNLYHEDDYRIKQLEFSKGLYTEAKQTRRYTKAMYMLTSDSNIKVEVRDEPVEPAPKAAPVKPRIQKKSDESIPEKKAPVNLFNLFKHEKSEEVPESLPEPPSGDGEFSAIFEAETGEEMQADSEELKPEESVQE